MRRMGGDICLSNSKNAMLPHLTTIYTRTRWPVSGVLHKKMKHNFHCDWSPCLYGVPVFFCFIPNHTVGGTSAWFGFPHESHAHHNQCHLVSTWDSPSTHTIFWSPSLGSMGQLHPVLTSLSFHLLTSLRSISLYYILKVMHHKITLEEGKYNEGIESMDLAAHLLENTCHGKIKCYEKENLNLVPKELRMVPSSLWWPTSWQSMVTSDWQIQIIGWKQSFHVCRQTVGATQPLQEGGRGGLPEFLTSSHKWDRIRTLCNTVWYAQRFCLYSVFLRKPAQLCQQRAKTFFWFCFFSLNCVAVATWLYCTAL